MRRSMGLVLALAASGSALAETRTAGSRLFVEQALVRGVAGSRLKPAPNRLSPGQSVVVLVHAGASAGGASLSVVAAVPPGLRFDRADRNAELSIDGGRRFGSLAALSTGRGRRALPADVTHLRWRIAPGARASVLSFRGTVR